MSDIEKYDLEGETIFIVKMKHLDERRIKFNIAKVSLTEREDRSLKIFLKEMVINEQYDNFVPIDDFGRLLKDE